MPGLIEIGVAPPETPAPPEAINGDPGAGVINDADGIVILF